MTVVAVPHRKLRPVATSGDAVNGAVRVVAKRGPGR